MTFPILGLFDIWALLIARLILGVIFFRHGYAKLKDLPKTKNDFTGMGFRPGGFWGTLVGVFETIGGLALILGFFTQVAAALVGGIMVVAITWKLKSKFGFGKAEIDFALLALAIVLKIFGGGAFALDIFLPQMLF
jgi:putative oxidoreductase